MKDKLAPLEKKILSELTEVENAIKSFQYEGKNTAILSASSYNCFVEMLPAISEGPPEQQVNISLQQVCQDIYQCAKSGNDGFLVIDFTRKIQLFEGKELPLGDILIRMCSDDYIIDKIFYIRKDDIVDSSIFCSGRGRIALLSIKNGNGNVSFVKLSLGNMLSISLDPQKQKEYGIWTYIQMIDSHVSSKIFSDLVLAGIRDMMTLEYEAGVSIEEERISDLVEKNLGTEKKEISSSSEDDPSYSISDDENNYDGPASLQMKIAETYFKSANLILVGDSLYLFNGKFYAKKTDKEIKSELYLRYRDTIASARSPVAQLNNATKLLHFITAQHAQLEEFPENSDIIVCDNGTLEINTGRFRSSSYKDFSNSALGLRYDPDRWDMPHTQRFLETIADGDDDLYERMLQVIGYILSNDLRAKSFFYLEGIGNSGKSRFCDLVASFFPVSGANKVARISLQDMGESFGLSNLPNAKLNISEDLPSTPLSPATVSRIKMISDGNSLEVNVKYGRRFSFKPTCKLLFASNHSLRLKEYDAAFVDRVVYIPFSHAIPQEKRDKHILEKMQMELPALFNHSLEAYKRLVSSGYRWAGAEKFKPEVQIMNALLETDKTDGLIRFIDSCCILDENAITPTSDLRSAYQDFCDKYKYTPILGDRFSRELANFYQKKVSRVKIGNQQRGYKGIKLK